MRPLPSDSTTQIVPVSAMAKLAPLMPTRADRNLAPQVQPGGLGQRGRLVRQGAGSSTSAHFPQEDLPDLRAVEVDRRHQNVRRAIVTELDDELGQVGLVAP